MIVYYICVHAIHVRAVVRKRKRKKTKQIYLCERIFFSPPRQIIPSRVSKTQL